MVTIVPENLQGREGYHLLTALIAPRPIAWVSSLAPNGVRNIAPHSYFNAISSNPLIVHFTSTGVKDSLRNVQETGEFVINFVGRGMVEAMNVTAADFPPEEDEFTWAGLGAVASRTIAPPRVAGAPAAFECKVNQIVSLGNGHMVFGDVLCMHIDEAVMRDGRVDPLLWEPIGRLGGSQYTNAALGLFSLRRPTWAELAPEGPPQRAEGSS